MNKEIMDLKTFEQRMKPIIEFNTEAEEFNDNLNKAFPESGCFSNHGYKLSDAYIELLESQFDNEFNSEWISYYVYECECGKKPMVVTVNKDKFKMKDIKTLYKVLTYKEKE